MRRRLEVGKELELSATVESDLTPGQVRKRRISPRRPVVGEEFDARVTVRRSWFDTNEAAIRSRIVWIVFSMCAIFLFGAATLGLYRNDFDALRDVWGVVGPIYGGIATYFFAPHARRGSD